ncbi:MAG: response regulator [Candidatus Promineifilaceae bacterium]|nr:response regulator [Candidatus Promineifilaceae bacterium]
MNEKASEKILIVDDDPQLVQLIGYTLYSEGYQTVVAHSGEEALQLVGREQPDLVILDVMMPGMSGIEVCDILREDPETTNLPIIILSARTQVPHRIEGLQAGADEYLTKPISLKEMVARVDALLERTRRLRTDQVVRRGRVIGFIGAKGGVGTTTVAANVALALAAQEKKVAAVELRPSYGTFALHLGRTPVENMGELLSLEPERIDEEELTDRLAQHPSGLQVLYGPAPGNNYPTFSFDHARAIVNGLASMADYTIVDLPNQPSAASRAALHQCDFVVLVSESDPASVQSARATLQQLQAWEVNKGIIGLVVVHRVAPNGSMPASRIASDLGCWIIGEVPPDSEACLKALRQRSALVISQPESDASHALTTLAAELIEE